MESVVYVMSGPAHCPYLVTSLYTLRRWWSGWVDVYAWPESYELVSRICKDPRLRAKVYIHEPGYRGKNAQFLSKIEIARTHVDRDLVLYLDADTLVRGPIKFLFEAADRAGFCATQFNDWTTRKGIIRKRLERLRKYKTIDGELIDEALSKDYPSVNGGVWACKTTSPVLGMWYRWTEAAKDIFIADECVLHLMSILYSSRGQFCVLDGKWNASPKFWRESEKSVNIWHGHGDCFTRPAKSPRGVRLWLSVLEHCMCENVGEIPLWLEDVEHKWLRVLLKHKEAHEKALGIARD